MICPHCNLSLRYRERSNYKCSKCNQGYAFEPRTDLPKLSDLRFRKAAVKMSQSNKLYFTFGQLLHFLSRRNLKSNYGAGAISSALLVIFFGLFFFSIWIGFAAAFAAAVLFAVAAFAVGFVLKKRATVSLLQNTAQFKKLIAARWLKVYQTLPPTLIADDYAFDNVDLDHARGFLICREPEILMCLAANQVHHNFGLILINPWSQNQNSNPFRRSPELPIFVLHDASFDGYEWKHKFIAEYLGNQPESRIFDIGLRPNQAIKLELLRLRRGRVGSREMQVYARSLTELTAEEKAWLTAGYHAPLLALTPAQLINLVARSVARRYNQIGGNALNYPALDRRKAESIGFMTTFGN